MKHVILEDLIKKFGENAILRKRDIEEYVQSLGYDNAKFLYKKKFNVAWGKFQLPSSMISSNIDMVASCFISYCVEVACCYAFHFVSCC